MATPMSQNVLPIMYAGNQTQRNDFVEDVIWHDKSMESSRQTIRSYYDMQTVNRPYVRPNIQEAIKFVKEQRQAALRAFV